MDLEVTILRLMRSILRNRDGFQKYGFYKGSGNDIHFPDHHIVTCSISTSRRPLINGN